MLHVSNGYLGSSAFGMAVVELRTTGRSSGLARSTILTAPIYEQHRVVLVASKGGDDRDPQWYRNILADSHVELTHKRVRTKMRARVASDDEASVLWPQVIRAYRPYASYQRRSSRQIPLVICEPI